MDLFINRHALYHSVYVPAYARSIRIQPVSLRCVETEQLSDEHISHHAVVAGLCRTKRHLYDQVCLHAFQRRFLAGHDDDLCHRFVVRIHLTNEVTLVTLYLLVVYHQIHHDRLAVHHGFRSVTETEERVELANDSAVSQLLQFEVALFGDNSALQ